MKIRSGKLSDLVKIIKNFLKEGVNFKIYQDIKEEYKSKPGESLYN